MADIHIHRDHQLGLPKARKVALQWAEQAESEFDMECTILQGETSDTVEFSRSGVKGELIVAANHFTLDAKLGFLLGAFSKRIEREIETSLDALLLKNAPAATRAAAKKVAAQPMTKPTPKPTTKPTTQPTTQPAAKKAAGRKA